MRIRIELDGGEAFEVYTSPLDRDEHEGRMVATFPNERLPIADLPVKRVEAWDVGAYPAHWQATALIIITTGVLLEFEAIP